MPKMVDIEKLKPLLANILTEENEAGFIEGVMGIAEDYDTESIDKKIEEAANFAREEARNEYNVKLHEMFFGGAKSEEEVIEDDTKTDPEIKGGTVEVEDIFEEVK